MLRIRMAALLMALLTAGAAWAEEFDPGSQALLVVNLSVPERVEASARLRLRSATLWSNGIASAAASNLDGLDSAELSGRAPRWMRFIAFPGILDSLVLDWERFDVRVEEAWTEVVPRRPTALALHRRVDRGEALVLNLRWHPDARPVTDPDWAPEIEVEELVEPPSGGRIYVTEEDEGIVSIFERAGGRMVRAVAVGGRPRDLAHDPLLERLYVAVAGRDEVAVVDVAGRAIVRRVPLGFGADPTRILLTRDRQTLAVVASGQDQVILYSTASLQEIARVRTGQAPVALAEDARGGRLFVTCRKAGEIDVIDPGNGRVLARFEGFESPTELVALRSGLLAVGQDRTNRVDLVDPASGALQTTLRLCGTTAGLVEVERFDRLYVIDGRCTEIAIFRPQAGLEVGNIPLDEPAGLPALLPRESGLLLPLPRSRQVVALSADRGELLLRCDVGAGPWRAIAP